MWMHAHMRELEMINKNCNEAQIQDSSQNAPLTKPPSVKASSRNLQRSTSSWDNTASISSALRSRAEGGRLRPCLPLPPRMPFFLCFFLAILCFRGLLLLLLLVLFMVVSATTPSASSNLTGVLDDAPLAEKGVVTNDGSASPGIGMPPSVETRGGVDAPGDIGGRGGLMTYYLFNQFKRQLSTKIQISVELAKIFSERLG